MIYGQDFTVEQLKPALGYGQNKHKNPTGKRGPDKKPRAIHPNSLRNLTTYRERNATTA